eukprot:scaffold190305_cov21-Prasinocladus_malaysianus.AAC.2
MKLGRAEPVAPSILGGLILRRDVFMGQLLSPRQPHKPKSILFHGTVGICLFVCGSLRPSSCTFNHQVLMSSHWHVMSSSAVLLPFFLVLWLGSMHEEATIHSSGSSLSLATYKTSNKICVINKPTT